MADQTISAMTEKTQLADTDILPVVDESGTPTTKKVTRKNLLVKPAVIVVAPAGSGGADYYTTGTADNTIIQSAINALPATGGTVLFREGTYNLAAGLTLSTPFSQLVGSGWGTILKLNNSVNAYVITYTPGASVRMDGVVIRDMKIDCNGANQTTAGGGINAFGSAFNVFDHLWIEAPWGNGLYLNSDNLGGFGHHNGVRNCTFLDGQNTNGGDGRAILMDQSDENIIEACIFQDNGRAAATEPNHIYDKAGLQTIIGNQFVGGQTGIKFQGPHSKAIGNTFDGCKNYMMRLNGNEQIVTGNMFFNIGNTMSSNTGDGIWVDNVSYCQISGNTFLPMVNGTGCRCGVNLSSGPATNNKVTDNLFTTDGQGTGTFGTAPIIVSSGANIIRNNSGFLTENSGTATVANGTTSIAVTHGLSYTPSINDIMVTPTNTLGSAAKFWVSTVTSTQFTINTDVNPGATTATFVWKIVKN